MKSKIERLGMIERARQYLKTPVFSDEDDARTAKLLDSFALISLAISFPTAMMIAIINPSVIGLLIVSMFILMALGIRFALQQGYVQPVAWIYTSVLWVLVTLSVASFGGIQSTFKAELPTELTAVLEQLAL